MISTLKLLFTIGLITSGLIMIIELIVSRIKKQRVYTLSDSISNLLSGILERCFDVFGAIFLFYIFYLLYNLVPWKIPFNLMSWIIALLITDFLAYWHHRLAHEVNFLWAIHIVHHQSEELNTTTVFRVSFFAIISRSFFFVFIPLMGFPPFMLASTLFCIGFYSFFTHNRFINKLGFLEKVMVTPSHHRVHHGYNKKYLDKNYGHIFIIWDKLYGTFMEEEEEPYYGITSGFESSSIFGAQFSYWRNLFTRASKVEVLKSKIKLFLKGPEYTPESVKHLPPEYKTDILGRRIHYRRLLEIGQSAYILINVLITVALFILLNWINLPKPEGEVNLLIAYKYMMDAYEVLIRNYSLALIGLILFSVFSYGYFMDEKKGYKILEILRLIANMLIVPFVFSKVGISSSLSLVVIAISFVMLIWLLLLKGKRSFV